MKLSLSQGSINGAVPESAHRGLAVSFGWLGAFASVDAMYIISAITGNYDSLIGPPINVIIIGAVISGILATVVGIGSALGILYQSRVVKRHGVRLNTVAAVAGAISSLVALGIAEYFWELREWDDYTAFISFAIVLSAAIIFVLLEILLRKGIILRPLTSLCHHCGYPIGTSPVCTECGKALA